MAKINKRRSTISSTDELKKPKKEEKSEKKQRRNTIGSVKNSIRKSFSRNKVLEINGEKYKNYKDLKKPSIKIIEDIKDETMEKTEEYSNKINELINDYLESNNLDDKKSTEFRNKISADYLVPITGPRRAVIGNEKALDMFWKDTENESGNKKNEEAFDKIIMEPSVLDLKETKPWCDCAAYFSAQLIKNFNKQHEESLKKQSALFEECCNKFDNLMKSSPRFMVTRLKREIKEALIDPDNIKDFEERVFKNGGFKKEICDPRVYNLDSESREAGIVETAEKIREMLEKEQQETNDLKYYVNKLEYYEEHKMLSADEIKKVRKVLEQMGPSENFKKYWEENVRTKVSDLSSLRKNVIANLKREIKETLIKYPNSIKDFEERVFKNGGFKKEICDSRIYNQNFKDQKIGLEETANKIRKLLRKEKAELDNLDYYLNKISEYEKDGNITNNEAKELRSVLEQMGPSKNFESFWRKKVSQKVGKPDIEKDSYTKKNAFKVFSEIKHVVKPILDKLELQSKSKIIKLKSKSGSLIIGKNVFHNYKSLKEPCESMVKLFKTKEEKYVKRIMSDIKMVHNIAKNFLTDESFKQLTNELNESSGSISASRNALNTYSNMLKTLWSKDESDSKEQELNEKMFSSILKKPSILQDNKTSKKRYCAAFKSAQILLNFPSENARTKAKQRIIICKLIDKIKKLMGLDDDLPDKKWKSGEINKNNARKIIIGNNRKR